MSYTFYKIKYGITVCLFGICVIKVLDNINFIKRESENGFTDEVRLSPLHNKRRRVIFKNKHSNLRKNLDFWRKRASLLKTVKNKFLCTYFGLKYKYLENFNKNGRIAFALAFGPHNDNNVDSK